MLWKIAIALVAAAIPAAMSAEERRLQSCPPKPASCGFGLWSPVSCDCLCAPDFIDDPTGGPCSAGAATHKNGQWFFCNPGTDDNPLNDCPWLISSSGTACNQGKPDNTNSQVNFHSLFNSQYSCFASITPNSIPAGASQITIFSSITSNPPTTSPVKSSAPTSSAKPSITFAPSRPPSISQRPSLTPTDSPSDNPSSLPTREPSSAPSSLPSNKPSTQPSAQPSNSPSSLPSKNPSSVPSISLEPSINPTGQPSGEPSEAPSSRPSKDCVMPKVGCGWGIWNRYSCQCVCAPNVCTHAQQCDYAGAGCNNPSPYTGCSPGVDCPWIPSVSSQNCISTASVPASVFTVYTNAKGCCEKHFGATGNCVANSVATLTQVGGMKSCNSTKAEKYYPDIGIGGTNNCVKDNCYDDWMDADDTYRQYYLFDTTTPNSCCNMWYPGKQDCPGGASVTKNGGIPDITVAWYNPQVDGGNCVTSKYIDSPEYMRQPGYPEHYLFDNTTYAACCSAFAPTKNSTECPNLTWTKAGGTAGAVAAAVVYPDCNTNQWFKDWGLNAEAVNACTNNILRQTTNNPTFSTSAACCTNWAQTGVACVSVDVCNPTIPTEYILGFLVEAGGPLPAGTVNPCISSNSASVGGMFYHPPGIGGQGSKCSNNCDYPSIWNNVGYSSEYLLSTPTECCLKWFGASSCTVETV